MKPALFNRVVGSLFAGSFALLTACGHKVLPPDQDPEGLWVGALVADEGACPTSDVSTLLIDAKTVVFNPAESAFVLRGIRGKDRQLFRAQLTLRDMHHQPYHLIFIAHPVGNAIGGTFGSPTCRAHVVMTRHGS